MIRKIFKNKASWIVLVLAVVAILAVSLGTTTFTLTSAQNMSRAGWGNWSRFTYTWAAATDTVIIPVQVYRSGVKSVTTPNVLNIYTQSNITGTTSDSVSLCVRYEVSSDNVNWQSYTLGTDSTTWATRLKSTSYPETKKLTVVPLAVATYGGYQPYCRLKVFGKPYYNKIGTKIWVDNLEQ